jgi:hypothetical protein
MWSDYDEALQDLTDTINGRAPSYAERARYEADAAEPRPDYTWAGADGQHYELYGADNGAVLFDGDGEHAEEHDGHDPYEPEAQIIEQAGALVATLAEHWSDLEDVERAYTTELAQDLLTVHHEQAQAAYDQAELEHGLAVLSDITDELEAHGSDSQAFQRVLAETSDLDAAFAAVHEIGRVPRDLDEGVGQALRYQRSNREAEHA